MGVVFLLFLYLFEFYPSESSYTKSDTMLTLYWHSDRSCNLTEIRIYEHSLPHWHNVAQMVMRCSCSVLEY